MDQQLGNGYQSYYDPAVPMRRLRRLIIWLVVAAFLIWGIATIIRDLTTGTLVVTTNSENTVAIQQIGDYKATGVVHQLYNKQVVGSTNLRLHAAQYSVTVTGKSLSTQQVITIKARKTTRLTIIPDRLSTPEPVTTRAASNLVVGPSLMYYTDLTNGNLYSVDATDTEHLIDSGQTFGNIQWANTSFGVAQDNNRQLYSIINGVVAPLAVPFSYSSIPSTDTITFSVAPDGTVYLAAGNTLYRGTASGNFKALYRVETQVSVMSASDRGVAVFEGRDEDSNSTGQSGQSQLLVIDPSGGAHILRSGVLDVSYLAWSATGKYLAGVVNNQGVVWNESLAQAAAIPTEGIGALTWLDDNTLLYGADSQLWAFRLDDNRANLLADLNSTNANSAQSIQNLTLSQDRAYIYILSEDQTNQSYVLTRVGLHNQPVPNLNILQQLAVFLPNTVDECSFGYLNFTHLAITVFGPAVSQSDCLGQAATYLQGYGLNTTGWQFNFSSGS